MTNEDDRGATEIAEPPQPARFCLTINMDSPSATGTGVIPPMSKVQTFKLSVIPLHPAVAEHASKQAYLDKLPCGYVPNKAIPS